MLPFCCLSWKTANSSGTALSGKHGLVGESPEKLTRSED